MPSKEELKQRVPADGKVVAYKRAKSYVMKYEKQNKAKAEMIQKNIRGAKVRKGEVAERKREFGKKKEATKKIVKAIRNIKGKKDVASTVAKKKEETKEQREGGRKDFLGDLIKQGKVRANRIKRGVVNASNVSSYKKITDIGSAGGGQILYPYKNNLYVKRIQDIKSMKEADKEGLDKKDKVKVKERLERRNKALGNVIAGKKEVSSKMVKGSRIAVRQGKGIVDILPPIMKKKKKLKIKNSKK